MKLRRQGCRRRIKSSGGQGLSRSSFNGPSLSGWQGSVLFCAVLGVFAFSCGVILLYRLSVLPPPVWLLGCTLTALSWFLPIRRQLPRAFRVFLFGVWFGVVRV